MKTLVERVNGVKGYDISIITLKNDNNISLRLMDYGAAIIELMVPDRNGKPENVVLEYKNIEDYIKCSTHFGMICGRTSGRIADGRFKIDGIEYMLDKNEKGKTNLHGGYEGFSFKQWNYEIIEKTEGEAGIRFYLHSKDMEEGYPGNVDAEVLYTLDNKNRLSIDYKGKTDKPTLLNMTNHSYFNLSGNYKRSITEQFLYINADRFIELNEVMIGINIKNVKGTPMDFTESKLIGQDINNPYLKKHTANGYDHPWILNDGDINKPQVILEDRESGRVMRVYTTYPSVVAYSYNYPDNEVLKGDITGKQHYAICLETQYEPNGINYPGLNNSVLRPEKEYSEKTVFEFEVNGI